MFPRPGSHILYIVFGNVVNHHLWRSSNTIICHQLTCFSCENSHPTLIFFQPPSSFTFKSLTDSNSPHPLPDHCGFCISFIYYYPRISRNWIPILVPHLAVIISHIVVNVPQTTAANGEGTACTVAPFHIYCRCRHTRSGVCSLCARFPLSDHIAWLPLYHLIVSR